MIKEDKYTILVRAIKNCWIANIEGDPGRTNLPENAQVFTEKQVERKIKFLRKKFPNRTYSVSGVPDVVKNKI